MATMKDGSDVDDVRLGRLEQFDERSRQFRAVDEVPREARERRSYTWRVGPPEQPVHLDQGSDGACVGFAFAHELSARPLEIPGLGYDFARGVYWDAQRIDPWPGGAYPDASPQYEGTSVLAGVKVLHRHGYIGEYRWCFGEDDLAIVVGYHGPVVVGTNWYEGMYQPDSDGFVRPTGRVGGGHAYLVYAADHDDGFYRIWNSWGKDWGDNGTAKISVPDMARLLDERGEACVPTKRSRVVDTE